MKVRVRLGLGLEVIFVHGGVLRRCIDGVSDKRGGREGGGGGGVSIGYSLDMVKGLVDRVC